MSEKQSDKQPFWKGLTVLVTGATSGIGAQTAARLAAGGAHLLVHGRSPERVHALVGELRAAGGTADGMVADLASLAEVAELARRITLPLDLLINNAGVGFGANRRARETSHDGFELRFAVNYLAPFVLTRGLLARGLPTRVVVNVASAGQEALDLDDLQTTRNYDGVRAYCRSKLALIMLTLDLAHERPALTFDALHPGTYLDTGMVRAAGITPLGPASQGADSILHVLDAALNQQTTGAYFDEQRIARADAQAYDLTVRQVLRAQTIGLVRRFL
jgi:NAD(P)-dependent dehydrogenase (short-subunit alcohol dehydrogenase family)